jgi:ribosomal protein S27AE
VELDEQAPGLVDPQGRPVSSTTTKSKACPRCGSGPDKRAASGGFGLPHPVCTRCGYEWHGEQWNG